MGKEYEKIRLECAKRYNGKIKDLEDEVSNLKKVIKQQEEDLKNQELLQKDFVKLCIFLKMSEEGRRSLLDSIKLNNMANAIFGGRSQILNPQSIKSYSSLAKSCLSQSDISFEEILDNLISSI